ncbi:MAG: alanine racemase [Actinomycetota bacterium]
MTIRLTIRTALWRSHVARIANDVDGLVPVVKGNGYGFGRRWLADFAAEFADTVAVGTVHELDDVPDGARAVVLTPTLTVPPALATRPTTILTVGAPEHITALRGWMGGVVVKLRSSMRRYGSDDLLIEQARGADLDVVGVSVHPPLDAFAGTRADVLNVLDGIDADLPAWVSHLDPATYAELPNDREYRLRLGTALWHGNKSTLHLDADVIAQQGAERGQPVGYRQVPTPADGTIVMIGAGSANGVSPLPDGRSPFHFARQRLALIEPPHMHTSMAFVPAGDPIPNVGDWVDLQRPLTMTTVDEFDWR